ncbi:MAG TPA: hypothetical protein VI197_19285 [Polyangiaceae bacterium]
MLTVENVTLDGFGIEAQRIDDTLCLTLTGTADMAAHDVLQHCLGIARADVGRLGLNLVRIDLRALYLLNSSCIKALLRLVYLAQTERPSFSIEFLVDPNLSWQARALAPLKRLAPELVRVT